MVATIELVATGDQSGRHPIVMLDEDEAYQHGEERVQLLERARYEYRLKSSGKAPRNLGLVAGRGIQPSRIVASDEERGLIEPADYCGLLTLAVAVRDDPGARPIAQVSVEVRSLKMGYRDHYRGMLSYIGERSAGLLIESRASTSLKLTTLWRVDSRLMEQQLEFLRDIIESPMFKSSMNQIIRNPHQRLEAEMKTVSMFHPLRSTRGLITQLTKSGDRVPVPIGHPIRKILSTLPRSVSVRRRVDLTDTPENRFIKSILVEFRDLLTSISSAIEKQATGTVEAGRLQRECARLRATLLAYLLQGFLPDIPASSAAPIGSPVLQRKAGYRELLRFWLQFHASARLAWDGGAEVFHAGARDVATLYEYWLFFQLESLFREKFRCEQPLHALVVDRTKVPSQLILKRGVQLETPVAGSWSETARRRLNAEFQFNRKFSPRTPRDQSGSWTRGAQPDYTISIWPAEYTRDEAEKNELMVHIHFDAKYRVEKVSELIGDEADDAAFQLGAAPREQTRSGAKYSDLMKMHAYRDAIRRTGGAYVLYPGDINDDRTYRGFHEILPGLGAFAVRPDSMGKAEGVAALSNFLDEVVEHLSDRTSSRERTTYHVRDAYADPRTPAYYGRVQLKESDEFFGKEYRAAPPAEHMVLVAWFREEEQVELARRPDGIVFVRLGLRRGSLRVHPNLSRVRHVALRSSGKFVAGGLVQLREQGFQVFDRADLQRMLNSMGMGRIAASWSGDPNSEHFLYAVFRTTRDDTFEHCVWDGEQLMELIEKFEADRRNKPVTNVGRSSPDPRVLPLSSLLSAQILTS